MLGVKQGLTEREPHWHTTVSSKLFQKIIKELKFPLPPPLIILSMK